MIIVPSRSSTIVISTPNYRSDRRGRGDGGDGNRTNYLKILRACVVLGICVGFLSYAYRPRYQMKFVKTTKGYDAMIRRVNFPNYLWFRYNNISFLCKEKGYMLLNTKLIGEGFEYIDWHTVASIETQKSFKQFRADCKKENVHMIISYQYNSFWSQTLMTKEKRLYWYKQKFDKLA